MLFRVSAFLRSPSLGVNFDFSLVLLPRSGPGLGLPGNWGESRHPLLAASRQQGARGRFARVRPVSAGGEEGAFSFAVCSPEHPGSRGVAGGWTCPEGADTRHVRVGAGQGPGKAKPSFLCTYRAPRIQPSQSREKRAWVLGSVMFPKLSDS